MIISNITIPEAIVREVVLSYLPDQDLYRAASISKHFCRVSYDCRVWAPRLARLQWNPFFFLPPAGAGSLSEIVSQVYHHFVPNRRTPFYANRQLHLANAQYDLADRYLQVVPGIGMVRARVRTQTWVRQQFSPYFWSLSMHSAGLYSLALAFIFIKETDDREHWLGKFFDGSAVSAIFSLCSIIAIKSLLNRYAQEDVADIANRYISRNIFILITGPLATVAGRVAEFVTLGQVVAQRVFQTVTCKVRVMVRRYWAH